MTTKTKRPRKAANAQQPPERIVPLRIEARLKVTGSLTVQETADRGWIVSVAISDSKLGDAFTSTDDRGMTCEAEALTWGLDQLWEWLLGQWEAVGLPGPHRLRLAEVQEQLWRHANQLVPDWTPPRLREGIPETEAQAEAKEAAVAQPLTEAELLTLNPALQHLDEPFPFDQVLQVPLHCVVPSPDNPRTHFDSASLEKLAVSLREHGQQQPITCYWNLNRELEIIDGERRYRATHIAQLPTVAIIIREVTLAQAIELRGIANLQREDLTPIEEAQWYQQLLTRCQYSQRELAQRLEISQAKLAESLALLKLPEEWQEQVTTHVITPTQARELAPWRERPVVLDKLQVELQAWRKNRDEPPTTDDFQRMIDQVLDKVSKPMAGRKMPFKPTKSEREQLDIVTVKHRYGGDRGRAFNVKLWNELAKQAKLKEKTKQQATKKSKDQQQPAYDPREVNQAVRVWLWEQIAERLATLPKKDRITIPRLLLLLLPSQMAIDALDGKILYQLLQPETPFPGQFDWDLAPLWGATQQLTPATCEQVLRSVVQVIVEYVLQEERSCQATNPDIQTETLWQIAQDLHCDLTGFVPVYEHLDLYDRATLESLPAAERLIVAQYDDGEEFRSLSSADLRVALIEAWEPGEFPPGWRG